MVKESLNESFDKREAYDKLMELGVEENMTVALCNFFDSNQLSEFIEFLEEEWT